MTKNNFKFIIFTLLAVMILFSTGIVSALSAVNLGTAGDFVILAKSGISTTGITSIVGDIGVSPIGYTAITGFDLVGVPFPIFLGVILAFCALIPAIGTAIIWVPASLFLILTGVFSHNYWIMWKGILLFLYGMLIISTIDNVLLATIVKAKAKVNQILIIVGVIGGAAMFGVMGIFIGPILLPLLVTYFETFKKRFE